MAIGRSTEPPRPPDGLHDAGTALWKALTSEYGFDGAEVAVLAAACKQCDDIAALEAVIASDGMTVPGCAGQQRMNAAIPEVRQGRLALGKLLGQLAIPSSDEKRVTAAQVRGRKAALARWDQPGARTREVRDGVA